MGNRVRRAALPKPFVVPLFGTDSKSYGKAKLHFKWFRTIYELVLESELVNFFGFLSKFLYTFHSLQSFFFRSVAPNSNAPKDSQHTKPRKKREKAAATAWYQSEAFQMSIRENVGVICRNVNVCVLCVVYSLAQNDCQTCGVFRVWVMFYAWVSQLRSANFFYAFFIVQTQ